MEYYSAIKWNVLTHATTWTNLENIMLRKGISHKGPCIIGFHLYEVYKIRKPVYRQKVG